LKLITISKIII